MTMRNVGATRASCAVLLLVLLTACTHSTVPPPAVPPPDPAPVGDQPAAPLPPARVEQPIPHEQRFAVDRARTFGVLAHRHTRAVQRAQATAASRTSTTPPADALGAITEQIDGVGSVRVSYLRGPSTAPEQWRIWQRLVVPADESPVEQVPLVNDTAPSEFERSKLRALLTTASLVNALPQGVGCHSAESVAAPTAIALSWRQGGRDVLYVYRTSAFRRVDDTLRGSQQEWLLDASGTTVLASNTYAADCLIGRFAHAAAPLVIDAQASPAPSAFAVYVAIATSASIEVHTGPTPLVWRITGDRVRTLPSAIDRPTEPIEPIDPIGPIDPIDPPDSGNSPAP